MGQFWFDCSSPLAAPNLEARLGQRQNQIPTHSLKYFDLPALWWVEFPTHNLLQHRDLPQRIQA